MKALGDLLVGLAMLAVFGGAAYGLWAAVAPDTAKAARDRTVRAVDRLMEDDLPAASTAGTAVPRRPARWSTHPGPPAWRASGRFSLSRQVNCSFPLT